MNTPTQQSNGHGKDVAPLKPLPPVPPETVTRPPDATPSPRRGRALRRIAFAGFALAAALCCAWFAGWIDVKALCEQFLGRMESKPKPLVLYGNVDVRQVNLAFKVEGRIASLAVDEGDTVKAGETLATLETRYFEDDLRLAQARRDAQAATLERLKHGSRPEEIAEARAMVDQRVAEANRTATDLARSTRLLARDATPRQQYDLDAAAAKVAKAQLDSAREALRLAEIGPRSEDIDAAKAQLDAQQVEVSQAERRLEDSQLIAPGRGVILTRAREVGAIVQPGETVFALTLSNPIWVRTYVSESDLDRIIPGARVYVATDGEPNRPYHGHIGFISPTAEFTPKQVETPELRTRLVYRVRIIVNDPNGRLRQGMPVTVKVPLIADEVTR